MTIENGSSQVRMEGVHYVVGVSEAPDEAPISDEVAGSMPSMREKFIKNWNKPSSSARERLTAEQIEEMGGLLWPMSGPDVKQQ